MSKHLFIGGDQDGEWREVEDGRSSVQMSSSATTIGANPGISFYVQAYYAERFYAGKAEWIVFRLSEMPVETVLERLIKNYKP